jgi:uncharacterized delta-60 repeat protein
LLADGRLDPEFDGDGRATLGAPTDVLSTTTGQVRVGPSGRILVATAEHTDGGDRLVVSSLRSDGTVERTFGSRGRAVVFDVAGGTIPGEPQLSIISRGRVLAAALSCAVPAQCSFAVGRRTGTGELDTGFAGTGTVAVPAGAGAATLVAMQATRHGDVFLAGHRLAARSTGEDVFVRLRPDGSPNAAFGTDGVVRRVSRWTNGWAPRAYTAAAMQADGRIVLGGVVVGSVLAADGLGHPRPVGVVARLQWNGTRDRTFGELLPAQYENAQAIGPVVWMPNPDPIYSSPPTEIVVQPDGKIVVLGRTATEGAGEYTYLLRLLAA